MDAGAMEGDGLNGGTKISYSSMAAKSHDTDGSPMKDLNFTGEEVVVLDEDCLVDESRAFSTIKFFDKVEFMNLNIKKWIFVNLKNVSDFVSNRADWDILFGSLLWNLWMRQNDVAFNGYNGRRDENCDSRSTTVGVCYA
ncbi:hypothetical protein V6N11_060650 [Hibiscus sabdariffa]|uniref:Uncharacterized protein n=1 Tax=Hibiscus sabdariffa TaxID=183260 RepID=A0ABR2QR34_9ROSI